jgi:hypothetical protein
LTLPSPQPNSAQSSINALVNSTNNEQKLSKRVCAFHLLQSTYLHFAFLNFQKHFVPVEFLYVYVRF